MRRAERGFEVAALAGRQRPEGPEELHPLDDAGRLRADVLQAFGQEDPHRLGGTLDEALGAGVDLGGEYVEVYQSDADASQNQSVLARQGDALEANLP